jgi:hypothetical protein
MTTDHHAELIEALERFLREARQVVVEDLNRDEGQAVPTQAFAQTLDALPACRDVNQAALGAAASNDYEMGASGPRRRSDRTTGRTGGGSGSDATASAPSPVTPKRYGRQLDADALVSTGIVGMLLSGVEFDPHAVAEDMASYLAGPPVDIWDYAILDGNIVVDEPILVADGWELLTPTAEDLRMLLPVPATAAYQPTRPFSHDDYAGLTMLRRINREAGPRRGLFLHFDLLASEAAGHSAHLLWQPLLALSLLDNSVLRLWARYQVEPGRRIDKLFDSVEWTVVTLNDGTDEDWPQFGDFGDIDVQMLRRFLAEVAPMSAKALHKKTAATRLQRSAEHFLSAGAHAHGEGEVLSELNAEAVLHYVIALEGLLAGADPDRADFRRKVSQRAAILAGETDAERLEIARLVRSAYDVRSAYAHGSYPEEEFDLPGLRRVVRRCLLTRLIVGDPTPDGELHGTADRALLSHEVLDRYIRQPFHEFVQRVQAGEQS